MSLADTRARIQNRLTDAQREKAAARAAELGSLENAYADLASRAVSACIALAREPDRRPEGTG